MMKKNSLLFLFVFFMSTKLLFAQFGTLDKTFNTSGMVTTYLGNNSSIHSMVLQPDGKIIAAGTVYNHTDYSQFGMVRYKSDGKLDVTFGINGRVVSNFIDSKISLNSVALQSNGKIIAAGVIYNNYTNSQFVLVRYTSDGLLDTSFGNGGMIIKDSVNINSIILQSDQSILAAGFYFESNNRDFRAIRYDKDGELDNDFAKNGVLTTSIGDKDFWYDVALQSDEKIVLVGSSHNTSGAYNSDYSVERFLSDGTVDTDFGINGIVTIDIKDIDVARSVKIQDDGKIIVLGWSYVSGESYNYKIIRLLSNGDLDSTFGNNGKVLSPISFNLSAEAIGLQNDRKIVISGYIPNGDNNDIAIVRLLDTGEFDQTFGDNGVVISPFNTSSQAKSILIQDDGKILIGADSGTVGGNGYNPNFSLLRFVSGVVLSNTNFNSLKNKFYAYPNPVKNSLNLEFNLDQSELLSIDLYDVNGRKIICLFNKKRFENGFNTEKIELPESLSNGIYFLNVSNGKNNLNIKIVK